MKCDVVSDNLLRYSEGAIGTWDAAMMRLHIARCEPCRRRLAALRESGQQFTNALATPVNVPDFSEAVMASLGTAPRRSARVRARWLAAPVAACALVAILVMLNHTVAPVKSKHTPRGYVAATRQPIQKRQMAEHSPRPEIRKHDLPRHHMHFAGIHRPRRAPERMLVEREPLPAQAPPPAPASVASSKVIIVVVRPAEPLVSRAKVDATNLITGTVVHYDATYDSSGNQQSTYMAFAKPNPNKEEDQL